MRLTSEQLASQLQKRGYGIAGYGGKADALASGVSYAIIKPDAGEDPLGADQDEAGGVPRITVRIERRGAKLLDKDNLYGSVKYLCDALRYANLIPADDPEAIDLIVTQKRVKRPERGTLVTIERG